VQRVAGAIGYVEYAYAKQNKLIHTQMQNKDGQYVQPDDESFKASAAGADWNRSAFYEILTDQPGKATWPISGATFILLHKSQVRPAQAVESMKFFDWSLKNGGKLALELDYVPLPDSVVKLINTAWSVNIKDGSGKALWPAR
jgi:phosphate transport system substrate-binding protein